MHKHYLVFQPTLLDVPHLTQEWAGSTLPVGTTLDIPLNEHESIHAVVERIHAITKPEKQETYMMLVADKRSVAHVTRHSVEIFDAMEKKGWRRC